MMISELKEKHLEQIMELEALAFPSELRAVQHTYITRFRLQHVMYGAWENNKLVGIIGLSYTYIENFVTSAIPDDFYLWSSQVVPRNINTVCIYNLGVIPKYRGSVATKQLIYAAISRAAEDGCHVVLGECPIPSYRGNHTVKQNETIKSALDDFSLTGAVPSGTLLNQDPHIHFYRMLVPSEILCIKLNFLPEDISSGGHRIILIAEIPPLIGKMNT